MALGRFAPWFKLRESDTEEHVLYRAWKRMNQAIPRTRRPNLFSLIAREEWDLLIILDACRYDVLRQVCDIGVVSKAISPASCTPTFLQEAYRRQIFDDTVYVSANPQVKKHSPSEGCDLQVVSDTHWDDYLNTVPPERVYDKAAASVHDGNRVVAHTLQPHYPHICEIDGVVSPVVNGLHPREQEKITDTSQIQAALSTGTLSLTDSRRSYEIATRFAWVRARDLAVELSQEGYKTVITSDHGELFGEWGLVEHPCNVSIEELVSVPWFVLEPGDVEKLEESVRTSVDDQLQALGYVS